ncbi:MAG: orotate phosphoribosyltransferase [Alphaproteobacteria bacterium]
MTESGPGSRPDALVASRERLRRLIAEKALVKGEAGSFRLASGGVSHFFFDMKMVALDPEGANLIADLVLEALGSGDYDHVGGPELGAIPIVAAVATKSFCARPMSAFLVRKEPKERGLGKRVEGHLARGARVALVEDVTTTGGAVLKAVEAVREEGCTVDKVITVVDRLQGARERLAERGIDLVSLFTIDDFRDELGG